MTVNLAGKARRERRYGKDWVVANAVLMVETVMAGNKGPLFYPYSEIHRDYKRWAGIPVVVNHPTVNGIYVSAQDPRIIEQFGIGTLFEPRIDPRLIAEVWIDVVKADRVDRRIVANLLAGVPLELSTGLHSVQVPRLGMHGTKSYIAVATNYVPDHLAILPEREGACSLRDGCGVLVNEGLAWEGAAHIPQIAGSMHSALPTRLSMDRAAMIASITANCDCWKGRGEELDKLSDATIQSVHAGMQAIDKRLVVANAALTGFSHNGTTFRFDEAQGAFVANGAQPQTMDQWLNSAPAEVREVVANAMQVAADTKAQLIASMTGHIKDAKQREVVVNQLNKQPLSALQTLSHIAPPAAATVSLPPTGPTFLGGVPVHDPITANAEEDLLLPPTTNWAEEQKLLV